MPKKKFQWVAGEEPEEAPQRRSKSERKRKARTAETLFEELLSRPELWESLELSDDVKIALADGARMKKQGGKAKSALRRHLRYAAGLLRRDDDDAIRERLERA